MKNKAKPKERATSQSVRCAYSRLVSPDRLKPNPANPNRHPEAQLRLYARIIEHQGWRRPIVVSKRSGLVVTGHGALEAAKLAGWKSVPVEDQDFASVADEMAHMLADNRLAELAEIDSASLAEAIKGLEGDLDLGLAGFDPEALAELGLVETQEVDAEPQIDRAAELQKEWKTKRGQIWELGEHRIMCGDSTVRKDVSKLMAEDAPHLMVTDPPYGVSYDPKWREDYDGNLGTRACGTVENDDRIDWTEAWKLFQGDVAYVWHADQHASEVQASLAAAGFHVRCQIIWAKPIWVFGRGDYHWQHEPCWYVVRKGKTGHFCGGRDQGTVWQIANNSAFSKDKEVRSGHGTQKPTMCMAKPISNNSKKGESVYDPFVGSGTTIIACENLTRRCLAMEISPAYVAVALQRWADATGKTPKLLK